MCLLLLNGEVELFSVGCFCNVKGFVMYDGTVGVYWPPQHL